MTEEERALLDSEAAFDAYCAARNRLAAGLKRRPSALEIACALGGAYGGMVGKARATGLTARQLDALNRSTNCSAEGAYQRFTQLKGRMS